MAIDTRAFTMGGQFAKAAQTTIPSIPIAGQAYRNPNITKSQIETGQAYNQVGPSALWNEEMFRSTGIGDLAERFGFIPWSPYTNYTGDASWCLGQDGTPYRALLNSGPGDDASPGVGAKPPPDTTYWETMADYIARVWSGGGSGGTSQLVYPSAFYDFFEQSPPSGWMVRNGGLITSADTTVPELWAALQQSSNSWKLKTESAWQTMSQATPWSGIGGVPFFVLDIGAKTIRLPDTRGMYKEDSGFDGLLVGGVHGDAIRNLYGFCEWVAVSNASATRSGVLRFHTSGNYIAQHNATGAPGGITMDASLAVPTASVNRPKAFGMLGCVYVGKPAA